MSENCPGLPEAAAVLPPAEKQEPQSTALPADEALETQTAVAKAQLVEHLPGVEGNEKKPAASVRVAAAFPSQLSRELSRGQYIVDGIDITKCPQRWKGIASVPGSSKRSIWWHAFHVLRQEDGRDAALCNVCGQILSRGKSSSTSSMKKHISTCHPKVFSVLLEIEGQVSPEPQPENPTKTRPQVKVSFGTRANDNADCDDDQKMPAAAEGNKKGSGKGIGKVPRPRFMIRMVGDVDITKCPEEYKDRATVPSLNKRSMWWNTFHELKGDDGNVCALCNLCSRILSMGNSASTSCMKRHMQHCHPGIFPVLLELENKTSNVLAATSAASAGEPLVEASAGAAAVSVSGKKRDRAQTNANSNENGGMEEVIKKRKKDAVERTDTVMTKHFLNELSMYAAFENRPFSDYDQAQFRQVIEAAVKHGKGLRMAGFGGFELPSADSIEVNLHELAQQAKGKLKVRLKGKKLSATTDHWISRARSNYVSLTVHWIEDFTVHSVVLAVYMFKGLAVMDQVLEDFDSKLNEWGISKSVPYVVTDTEEKTNKFGEVVYEQLGIEQINCIDYSIQLVANIALHAVLNKDDREVEDCWDELSDFDDEDSEDDGVGEGDDVKDKDDGISEEDKKPKATDTKCTLRECRAIVGYFCRSTECTNQLKKLQFQDDNLSDGSESDESKGSLELILDVVPRWWSTLAMIDRLLFLKGPLGVFESIYGFKQRCRGKKRGKKQGPIEMPNKQEWETLEALQKLLKPLEPAKKILEGSKYVTSSLVLYIVHVIHGELVALSELTGRENEKIVSVATKMLETFEQQFASDLGEPFTRLIKREVDSGKNDGLNKVFIFAHALDPRFKSLAAIATKDKQRAVWEALHTEMCALGPPKPGGNAPSSDDEQVHAADKKDDPDEKSSWASGSKFDAYASAQPPKEADAFDQDKWRLQCKTEIMAYEREPALGLTKKNENPLIWWKENALSYPTLWRLAEIYFAVPATAAMSERAFSVQGNMVTMSRCRSKTDTSDDCHFLHENAWIVDD